MSLPPYKAAPGLDILGQLEANFDAKKVGIVEFAQSPEFCGRILYPRQRLLLKLFFLEELTEQEDAILDSWIHGGRNGTEIEISPGIRERMEILRARGFHHFPEIVLVGGRRCSKGFITGLALAKLIYDMTQLQDPGAHYGIDTDKDIVFGCVAASQDQAKQMQYADLSAMVNSCKPLQRHIFKLQELECSVMTEADIRKLESWKRQNRRVQRDISKIRIRAMPANSRTIRGLTAMGMVFDEFAHFQQGESDQSDSEVYSAATPALAQFPLDSIRFCNSSPFSKVGKLFERFEAGLATDNGEPEYPEVLTLRFPSWALYEGWWEDPTYVGPKKCNPPEAPIWMSDLSFRPLGEIQVGDKVMGWSMPLDKADPRSKGLKVTAELCESQVLDIARQRAPLVKVTLASGRVIRCTPDHRWLTASTNAEHPEGFFCEPKVGRKLCHVIEPTPDLDETLIADASWLAGIFDGEGHAARGQNVSIGQCREKNPEVCDRIERTLDRLGIEWSYGKQIRGGQYRILGGLQGAVNLANWLDPAKRAQLVDRAKVRSWRTHDQIVSIEPDGFGEVISMMTTTGNYVAWGYASKNCITVSPDWDYDLRQKDGALYFTESDRQAIIIARNEEKDDPIKFKVERRGAFAETIDAYLIPEMVDRMFAGRPIAYLPEADTWTYESIRTNWEDSTYMNKYYAHLDPSSTTAGFGFALGHTEEFALGERVEKHVIFDIIKRWDPKEFPDHTIDWDPILEWLTHICDLFRPVQMTMDQFNSAYPITWLRRKFREKRIETRVFEKTATGQTNWDRAEIFRTALYRGLIHAPNDTMDDEWCIQELKFLQEIKTSRIPRVEKQDTGPVQTKDLADCVMTVTEVTIGDLMAAALRQDLGSEHVKVGASGGYAIGGGGDLSARAGGGSKMGDFYASRVADQRLPSGLRSPKRVDPARRVAGGRPVPRRLPGW